MEQSEEITEGAHVRFSDAFLDETGAVPFFGYFWGYVVTTDERSAWVKWDVDGVVTQVSNKRHLTTDTKGKYADRKPF